MMAMVTLVRCEKCKKWYQDDELDENGICEACLQKEQQKAAAAEEEDDIKQLFLKYIKRSGATSLATLAKKYKSKATAEEAEKALEELEAESKVQKRESKNKKGKFVYEIVKE